MVKNNPPSILRMYRPGAFGAFIAGRLALANQKPSEEQLAWFREQGVSNSTSFLRDLQVLEVIKRMIIPGYQGERGTDSKTSIASVGCSMGREPYSVLFDNWEQRDGLVIRGYDINPQNLELARAAGYGVIKNSERFPQELPRLLGLPQETREQAFTIEQLDDRVFHLSVSSEARRYVSFYLCDILERPLPCPSDVLLLQNVLMHFSEEGGEQILRNVYHSLVPGGWLLCEPAVRDGSPKKERRAKWMERLERFGLQKQRIGFDGIDYTAQTQVYRRS